jgi:hypothetical protein
MQKIFVAAALLFSVNTYATTVEITHCESKSSSHKMVLDKVSEGVEIRFEENTFDVYPDTGRSPSYKVTGKSVTQRLIHGITLQELSRNSSLLKEPIVSILRSRPEFDGEADMSYAYANDFIQGLGCK